MEHGPGGLEPLEGWPLRRVSPGPEPTSKPRGRQGEGPPGTWLLPGQLSWAAYQSPGVGETETGRA